MGASKWNNLLENYKNPGPGEYSVLLKNSGGFSFYKDKKLWEEKLSFKFNPGPGTYDASTKKLSEMRSGPAISIG